MNHGYFKDRISAFYDNNLPPQEQVIIEQHLKECEECRKYLADLERLDKLVEEQSQLGEDDYWEQSAKKIEQKLGFEKSTEITEVASTGWFGNTWKLVAVAASVVFLTVVGVHRDEIWQVERPVQQEATRSSSTLPPDTIKESVSEVKGTKERVSFQKATTDEKAQPDKISNRIETEKDAVEQLTEVPLVKVQDASPQQAESKQTIPAPASGVVAENKADMSKASTKIIKSEEIKPDVTGAQIQTPAEQVEDKTAVIKKMAPGEVTVSESLAKLRQQKDSLMQMMVKESRWKDKSNLVQSLTGDTRKEKDPRSPVDLENDLLQTCYKIAELTNDNKEREAMKDIIKKVAEDNESPNQALAKSYLEQLLLQK